MKNSFVLYTDYIEQVQLLNDQQAGQLFRAILNYATGKNLPDLDGMTTMAFSFIRTRMDRDAAEYQKTVEARSKAGKLGGRPRKSQIMEIHEEDEKTEGCFEMQEKAKKANGFFDKQTEAKKPDNVLVLDNDIDKKKDTNVSKEKTSRFLPPTREEVSTYCQEKGYTVDADRFVDFYESKGWYVGKNKMKDWKAAVRNWARSQRQELTAKGTAKPSQQGKTRFHNFEGRENDYESAIWKEIREKASGRKEESGE